MQGIVSTLRMLSIFVARSAPELLTIFATAEILVPGHLRGAFRTLVSAKHRGVKSPGIETPGPEVDFSPARLYM